MYRTSYVQYSTWKTKQSFLSLVPLSKKGNFSRILSAILLKVIKTCQFTSISGGNDLKYLLFATTFIHSGVKTLGTWNMKESFKLFVRHSFAEYDSLNSHILRSFHRPLPLYDSSWRGLMRAEEAPFCSRSFWRNKAPLIWFCGTFFVFLEIMSLDSALFPITLAIHSIRIAFTFQYLSRLFDGLSIAADLLPRSNYMTFGICFIVIVAIYRALTPTEISGKTPIVLISYSELNGGGNYYTMKASVLCSHCLIWGQLFRCHPLASYHRFNMPEILFDQKI